MFSYIALGSTPFDEECAQVGNANYHQQSLIECQAFIEQLRRMYILSDGASFVRKGNQHDFGTYYEVNIKYPASWDEDESYSEQRCQLYDIENEIPANWDEEAKDYLLANEYTHI